MKNKRNHDSNNLAEKVILKSLMRIILLYHIEHLRKFWNGKKF